MYRKIASSALLTINKEATFSKPKVLHSSNSLKHLLDSIKTLSLVRKINTSTAETNDYQYPDTHHQNPQFESNQNSFYRENNHTGFPQNPQFQSNQDSFDRERNRRSYTDLQQTPQFQSNNLNGYQQNSQSGVNYRGNVAPLHQNPQFQPSNLNGYQQNGENVAALHQTPQFQSNPGPFYREEHNPSSRGEGLQQNPQFQSNNPSGYQQNSQSGVNYSGNGVSLHQNPQFQPNNLNGHQQNNQSFVNYRGNVAPLHQNPQFQPNNLNGYQQNSQSFVNQKGNVVELQQKPIGFQGNPSLSNNQLGSEGGFDFKRVTGVDGSVQATETVKYMGTLEELDGLCKEGKLKEAVQVLGLLEKQCINVDLPRYYQLMKLCVNTECLQEAKAIHRHLMRSGNQVGDDAYNMILDMFFKCGSAYDAYKLFEKMAEKNMKLWSTMIIGLTKSGYGEEAIDLFTRFKEMGLKPDGKMFVGVFFTCGALCDVDEGMLHFECMSKVYGISPTMDHYVSIVDMLGSTGYLDEALEFIEKMPIEPSVDIWEKLMNLSRIHGNLELGDHCAEMIEHLDPSGMAEQSKARLLPVQASKSFDGEGEYTLPGLNFPKNNRTISFRAGDKSHPQADSDSIYALLRGMSAQMKEAGYMPITKSVVLHDIDEEGKEEAVLSHSEKLACAQALLTSAPRTTIRIVKNLRVCADCHNAFKFISKIVGREITQRDAKRWHHFKDGVCSCRDYY